MWGKLRSSRRTRGVTSAKTNDGRVYVVRSGLDGSSRGLSGFDLSGRFPSKDKRRCCTVRGPGDGRDFGGKEDLLVLDLVSDTCLRPVWRVRLGRVDSCESGQGVRDFLCTCSYGIPV